MAKCIAQVALHRKGNLPADDVVNTWHFESDHDFDTDTGDLRDRLEAFYDALGAYWGSSLNGTGTIKLYDWDDPTPRVPKVTSDFTHGTGATAMPAEVCLCLSMSAEVVSGETKARRRGRVYLGPLITSLAADTTGAASDRRIPNGDRTTILDAAATLATGSAGTYRLAVYSPRTQELGGTADEAWNDVVLLWMDDAFDIQRRRGSRALTRDTRDI
jgi:hypothetical protein